MSARTVHPALLLRAMSAWREEMERGPSWRTQDDLSRMPQPHPPILPCDGSSIGEIAEHGRAEPKLRHN